MRRPLALALGLALTLSPACADRDRSAGAIEGGRRPESRVRALDDARREAGRRLAGGTPARQVLFGDLHVHTTFSIDALFYSLPFFAGEGAHPPADACDFARYCAGLDFFSINDHAEGLIPARWTEIVESIRECNARAGDPADPDLVAFVGWEWTQVGATPEEHFGHKNVIFPGLADDELPARPIDSLPPNTMDRARGMGAVRAAEAVLPVLGLGPYTDFLWLVRHLAATPACEDGVDTRELPRDCRESASTPEALFEKLRQWGHETLVIPHGLAWGVHAPPGARLDNQLSRARIAPEEQRLIEVFSGHGNGEEYRNLPERAVDANGERFCPEPTPDFLPCCWRAGEIVRSRCGDLPAAECERRVAEARRLVLEAGVSPHLVLPELRQEDWLDCDQCRDCFKPAFNLRPGETTQYGAALSNFDEPDAEGRPARFRWGFIASTDNHAARPGTGYKQYARPIMTDARGVASEFWDRWSRPYIIGRQEDPRRAQPAPVEERGLRGLMDVERGASFLYPGGIVAVHAAGRDRRSIWQALHRREVYGTSGPRMLLWFDLLNAPGGPAPMGSEVVQARVPRFQVRAAGAFQQRPGCPEESLSGLAPGRLERLCRGECYHPGDARLPIAALEIVRIRPQRSPGEDVSQLVDDPWLRFECAPDPNGCAVSFEDPDFPDSGRDAVYYARALQVATPAINGDPYRTEFDARGRAVRTRPCHGSYRTPRDDDCLTPVHERAWSSPIYVDQPR